MGHSAMGPNRLLLLLCLAPWVKAAKDSEVKEEIMMRRMVSLVAEDMMREEMVKEDMVKEEMILRMVNLVAEVQQQLQQFEQKNIDLSFDMERREKEMEEKLKKLESENAEQGSKLAKLEARVSKESAYLMTCAQRNSWPTFRNATITFDYLTADFNNADIAEGADGQLDIVTGLFTSLTAGVYEVTFSGVSVISPGGETESSSDQYFYLMHNGESEGDEAEWWSKADSGNLGDTYDMGSRTVILRLQLGDTLSLMTGGAYYNGFIDNFTFCVKLLAIV